ncbi:MAG: large-conductance mechanosensitive channel protein MscL [Tepidisphaeraceae bacterium]
MISEFKEFAMKGSVVDLAVGVIIGGAFGKIVSSLVTDIMMPPLGLLLGGVDFSQKMIVLKAAVLDASGKVATPATTLNYGLFINNVINFMIVAISIFAVIKLMNAAKKAPPAPDATTKECPRCCSTIPIKATRCPDCTSDLPATA